MIAVYVNEEGVTALPGEKGNVRIYDKKENDWLVVREDPFELGENKSISGIRRYMQEMVQRIEGCKVFVGKAIAGQLYYVLEANGFESFEADGHPETFLDSILKDMTMEPRKTAEKKLSPDMYINPTEEVGVYFLNLKTALNLDCSLTSKKLLMPFLKKREFRSLEILCDHVPRWFDTDLIPMNLHATVIRLNDYEYRVFIMPI